MDKNINLLERVTGDGISKELFELKKKLAEDITDKLEIFTPFKKHVVDYLVDKWTVKDLVDDKTINKLLGWLWIITEQLQDFRDQLSGANTEEALAELRTKIFKQIWGESQESSESNESTDTSKNTNTSTWAVATTWWASLAAASSESKSTTESWAATEKAKVDSSGESYEIDHFNITVSPEYKKLWDNLKWKEKPDLEPFACAMKAYQAEKAKWTIKNDKYLTVVDFTKNQLTHNRFFVIDLTTNTVIHAEKCWHGEGSGDKERATSFWNVSGSKKSSLWASITPDQSRSNSKWTRRWSFPKWLEKSNNASRWIAIHPVKSLVYKTWRPTSQWCFTLTCWQDGVDNINNEINWWSMVFAYAKSKDYFSQSNYFQQNSDGSFAA